AYHLHRALHPWNARACTVPAATAPPSLSLHDALPISLLVLLADMPLVTAEYLSELAAAPAPAATRQLDGRPGVPALLDRELLRQDRKSTRLNSSHVKISYAVFCLKKKIGGNNPPAVTT